MPLKEAIAQNDVTEVRRILKEAKENEKALSAETINERFENPLYPTPLLWAIRRQLLDIAKDFISQGADVTVSDKYGDTALHYAVRYTKDIDFISTLLAKGAKIDAQDTYGCTALLIASRKSSDAQAKHFLIQQGANPAIPDNAGRTAAQNAPITVPDNLSNVNQALYWALNQTREEVEDALNAAGCDINARLGGLTPLIATMTVRTIKKDVFNLLLERGANPNVSCPGMPGGSTPLLKAVTHKDSSLVLALLNKGANINATDEQSKRTPLLYAIERDLNEIASILIQQGADPNVPNYLGHTPLHRAASKPSSNKLIQELLDAQADINALNDIDRTPLDNAIQEKNDSNVKILRAAGAKTAAELLTQVKQKKLSAPKYHLWNYTVSLLAGLTIIYPIVRTIQYFWRLRDLPSKQQPPQKKTAPEADPIPQQALGYKAWALFYECGLEGKFGASHTRQEIEETVPNKKLREQLKI